MTLLTYIVKMSSKSYWQKGALQVWPLLVRYWQGGQMFWSSGEGYISSQLFLMNKEARLAI